MFQCLFLMFNVSFTVGIGTNTGEQEKMNTFIKGQGINLCESERKFNLAVFITYFLLY